MSQLKESNYQISEAEWDVMRVVWTLNAAHSKQIIAALDEKHDWSESTVKTLLRRLTQKGLLETVREGRRFLYRPSVSQPTMIAQQAGQFLDKVCDMYKGAVLIQLLKESPVSKEDLKQLQKVIENKVSTAPDKVPCNCIDCSPASDKAV